MVFNLCVLVGPGGDELGWARQLRSHEGHRRRRDGGGIPDELIDRSLGRNFLANNLCAVLVLDAVLGGVERTSEGVRDLAPVSFAVMSPVDCRISFRRSSFKLSSLAPRGRG